jgi:hypothetical protein
VHPSSQELHRYLYSPKNTAHLVVMREVHA